MENVLSLGSNERKRQKIKMEFKACLLTVFLSNKPFV
jgi:hypothetical protein